MLNVFFLKSDLERQKIISLRPPSTTRGWEGGRESKGGRVIGSELGIEGRGRVRRGGGGRQREGVKDKNQAATERRGTEP